LQELERAVDILLDEEGLETLFEKPDPREALSNRKKGKMLRQARRIDRAAAKKGGKQAQRSESESLPN
jgi:hypothetical protein